MKTTLQKNILALCILVFTVGALNAQDIWTGTTDTNFSTASNWTSGELPSDEAVTIPSVANNPVLNADFANTITTMKLDLGASLTLNSAIIPFGGTANTVYTNLNGTLTLNGTSVMAINHRVIISGDVVNINDTSSLSGDNQLFIGNGASTGTVNVNGGSLSSGFLRMANASGGNKSILNINSGTVTVGTLQYAVGETEITIDEGSFVINGDQVSTIEGLVTDGMIIPASGKTIVTVYDSVTDTTTVTATGSLGLDNTSKVTTIIKAIKNNVYVSNVKSATEIKVFSITGALVKTLNTTTDTNFNLPSGIWIATVKTTEGQKSVKLLCK